MGNHFKIYDYEPVSPCMDCEDRIVGCHSTCEKYIAYRKDLSQKRNEEKKKRYGSTWYWEKQGVVGRRSIVLNVWYKKKRKEDK